MKLSELLLIGSNPRRRSERLVSASNASSVDVTNIPDTVDTSPEEEFNLVAYIAIPSKGNRSNDDNSHQLQNLSQKDTVIVDR